MDRVILGHGTDTNRPIDIDEGSPLHAAILVDSLQPVTEPPRDEPPPVTDPTALYRTHFAFVWRNLHRLGVPKASLEDAAQDVFLIVHRRWSAYDERRSSLETWLFGILIRVASNYRRTFRRRLAWLVAWYDRAGESSVPSEVAQPATHLEKHEDRALLDRILAGLDEKKRDMLLLVDVEGLTVPEAAQALGINLNTAYYRLRSARQNFQQLANRIVAKERRPRGGEHL
jgi:RNA polymerase sigma-70 factor (ECF subfamily)